MTVMQRVLTGCESCYGSRGRLPMDRAVSDPSAAARPPEVGARRRGSRGIGPLGSRIGSGGIGVGGYSSARAGSTSLVGLALSPRV